MRRAALALGLVVLAAGCGGTKAAETHLTVSALNPTVGMAVFHIECPAPEPSTACDALGSNPSLVTAPKPFTCLGGPSSWFDMTISGRLAGKPVHEKFSTCWTPQMATLGKLGLAPELNSHIRPQRHGVVLPGIPRTFPARSIRPGDLLVCRWPGHHPLELGVPDRFGRLGSVGQGGRDVVAITLTGTRHSDGSVTASCHRGGS